MPDGTLSPLARLDAGRQRRPDHLRGAGECWERRRPGGPGANGWRPGGGPAKLLRFERKTTDMSYPIHRPRRLRRTDTIRRLVRETHLSPSNFIEPLFVCARRGRAAAHPGDARLFPAERRRTGRGMPRVARVGHLGRHPVRPPRRQGSRRRRGRRSAGTRGDARSPRLRRAYPSLSLWADVCLCEYTDHGHCGPLATGPDGRVDVDNDGPCRASRTPRWPTPRPGPTWWRRPT